MTDTIKMTQEMQERKLRRMAEEMQDFANLNGYYMVDIFTCGDDYVHVYAYRKKDDEDPCISFTIKGRKNQNE